MFSDAVLMANDTEPDGDAIVVDRVDSATSAGGTITNHGDGTYTYAAPAAIWALRSMRPRCRWCRKT